MSNWICLLSKTVREDHCPRLIGCWEDFSNVTKLVNCSWNRCLCDIVASKYCQACLSLYFTCGIQSKYLYSQPVTLFCFTQLKVCLKSKMADQRKKKKKKTAGDITNKTGILIICILKFIGLILSLLLECMNSYR